MTSGRTYSQNEAVDALIGHGMSHRDAQNLVVGFVGIKAALTLIAPLVADEVEVDGWRVERLEAGPLVQSDPAPPSPEPRSRAAPRP